MEPTPPIDALLENASWLKRLARQLLADEGLADDALQETWIAALRHGAPAGAERPWLARVLRNFAAQVRRSEGARTRRETRAARPERLPSTDATVARAELHAKLVQAVLGLDEPYRTTILWRYFDALSAEEIARRAGIDPATIRSRVARARERLRAALQQRDGEPPERWLAALCAVDLQPGPANTTLVGAGGALVGLKSIVVAAVVVLAAVVFLWRGLGSKGSLAPRPVATSPGDVELLAALLDEAPLPPPGERREALPSASDPAEHVVAASPMWFGTVVSDDGDVPLAGARVSYRAGSEAGFADPDQDVQRTRDGVRCGVGGTFELEISPNADEGLWFEADDHFPLKLVSGDLPRDGATPIEVSLAPLGRIELDLVDDTGAQLAELPVRYSIDVNRGSLDHMWAYRRDFAAGRTDPAGRLIVTGLPCGMPIDLRAGEGPFGTAFLGVVVIDPRQRVLHHTATLPRKASIRGVVAYADGRPARKQGLTWEGHPIGYGEPKCAAADLEGRFWFTDVAPSAGELRIDVAGFEPLELTPHPGETLDVGTLVLPDVVELAGRIVSPWSEGDGGERALDGVSVRAWRAGRELLPYGSDGPLRLHSGEFSTLVTDGPLELVVSRGETWRAGSTWPRRVLARVRLDAPRTGIEIEIDADMGALEVELGQAIDAPVEVPELSLLPLDPGDPSPRIVRLDASGSGERSTRFAPIAPGRYRAGVDWGGQHSALVGDVEVRAGVVTRVELGRLATGWIDGSVQRPDGAPVSDASVEWRGYSKRGTTVTDAEGRFRVEGLCADDYDLEVRHGDFGAAEREDVAVFTPDGTHVEIVLAGFAGVVGHVRSAGRPLGGISVDAQPVDSNDSYNAITDAGGEFRFERLPSCRLRIWIPRRELQVHDLEPGETREIEFQLDEPTLVTFVRDGTALEGVIAAAALPLDAQGGELCSWRTGIARDGGAELAAPVGRALYAVCIGRRGYDASFLAVAERASPQVELARGAVTLDTQAAWQAQLPAAMLVSIDGREITSRWGREIELAVERDAAGRAWVPCIPDGARIRIVGFDSRGASCERLVDYPAQRSVEWP